MELNREQIKRALECCINDECDKCGYTFGDCQRNLMREALSLIKQLTEENERLRAEKEVNELLVKDLRFRNKELQKANEGLAKNCEELEIEIEGIPERCAAVKTDTVREFAERVLSEYEVFDDYDEISIGTLRKDIDQIAKEILGE